MEINYKLTRIVKGKPLPQPGSIYLRVEVGELFRVIQVKTGYPEETYRLAAKAVGKELVATQEFATQQIENIFKAPTWRERLKYGWRRFLVRLKFRKP